MKKLIFALVWSSLALAQAPGPNVNSGRFMAANYGQWQVQVQSSSASKACVSPTNVVLADGSKLNPWNINASLLIGSGANVETVTPTSFDFVSTPGQVCISATYTKTHFFGDTVSSGTFGLQEALNAAGVKGGGAVTIDQNWTALGGTTAIKNAASLPTNVLIEDTRAGVSSGGSTPATTPNTQAWYLVPQSVGCGTNTNCTAIFGDGQVVTDATSNSTTTVTCPNNDCNFVAGDVGKAFWATTAGTGAGGTGNNTTFVCPLTTIATVNSAQSVTLNLSCTASGTANVTIIWGHRDGATLHALDGNSSIGCKTIVPFNGATILIDQAIWITPPTCLTTGVASVAGYPQRDWIPIGNTVSLIITPDFNYATCTGNGGAHAGSTVCIGTGLNELDHTGIWGTGLTPASNSNCANANGKTILALNTTNAAMTATNLSGVCPGENGQGAELATFDESWIGGGVQYSMTSDCVVSGTSVMTQILDCRSDAIASTIGMAIASGATVTDISTYPIVGLHVFNSGFFQSRGTHYWGIPGTVGAVTVDSGGTFYSYGDYIGPDSCGGNQTALNVNGTVQSANTRYCGNGTGAAIQFGTGTFTSLGGNTITGGTVNYFAGNNEIGTDILQGSCTGVVSSASTIGLYGLGNNTTTTCTSTTTNIGPTLGKAGTIFSFGCYAATQGNQAADACTVMKNNVATALTCSLNGVTFCGDGAVAHQVSYAQGDIITVKVVSGTSTTLANVRAAVVAW